MTTVGNHAVPVSEHELHERLERLFLTDSRASHAAYTHAMDAAQGAVARTFARLSGPYSGAGPSHVAELLAGVDPCPKEARPLEEVLADVEHSILAHSVLLTHPQCVAHLHCPVLIPALAAELVASATNQSMDSWDQSPAATHLEQKVIGWLCAEFGFPPEGDGIFTTGGTLSNFMGLLLARDHYAQNHLGWAVSERGLPADASRWRILCSSAAHFTIVQAASLLGLGRNAVVTIPTDQSHRMSLDDVDDRLADLRRKNLEPIALVATAGTTDTGSIDPLAPLAARAKRHHIWLHVDAAYGGTLILSPRYRPLLAGIEDADSIAVDFHKLLYQPISCGAFLVRSGRHFDVLRQHADYLNPREDETDGILNLVTKSLQTTRRFDALKLFVSLQSLGRTGFASLIERPIALAAQVADLIAQDQAFELANRPTLSAVLFRYRPTAVVPSGHAVAHSDRINRGIRRRLRERGLAMIAETRHAGQTYLKLTLINPRTTLADLSVLLTHIKELGATLETELEGHHGPSPHHQ